MDIFIVVLQSVLVLLGIGIIGFWIARRNVIPENVLSFLSRLAIDIALPCLVFASIMVNFSPLKYPDWWQLPLWWVGFAFFSLILTLITTFISNKETRGEFAINLFFQNGLFFPLIVISGIFGTDASYLPQLYIFTMLHPIMFFSSYQLFFKGRSGKVQWNRIFNPIFVAIVLAIIVQLFGVKSYLPDFIHSILGILGGMALPLIMIILGGSLYLDFHQGGKLYVKEMIKFIIIKNVVFPFACLGLLILIQQIFDIGYNIALMYILQSAVPPVTATPILAERAGGNKSIANQFVFSSFFLSVITIPAVFHLFSQFFPIP